MKTVTKMTMSKYTILLFYKYTPIDDPKALAARERKVCEELGLTGRVIVAGEGINSTLEGTTENTEKYLEHFLADPRFADTHIKRSEGTGDAFPRLSVKVRNEIVSLHLGDEDFSPEETTGVHLAPHELKKWFSSGKEFYIVDMRNDYEYMVGRFTGSILPKLQNFRDVPKVLDELEHLKDKTVLSVCTGGVRCEKASGYLLKKGFSDVYQLDGGIVSYMEQYPGQEFEGSLYVFDKRKVMTFDSPEAHVVVGKCFHCGLPSEHFTNCQRSECNGRLLCCEVCIEKNQGVFCSEHCRMIEQAKTTV